MPKVSFFGGWQAQRRHSETYEVILEKEKK